MKKLLVLPLILLVIFNSSCLSRTYDSTNASALETSNILFIGLDDAAQNMDVLCFVSYRATENSLAFVQLPRDTYFDFGGTQNKINQIYSFYRASFAPKVAMSHAVTEIAQAMSIPLDGFLAITTKGLVEGINALGGVEIDVTEGALITDELGENPIALKEGKNRLSGEECVQFLRYRKGYITGDLGRLDAQKLFFHGMLDKLRFQLTIECLMRAYVAVQDDIITNLNLMDWMRMTSSAKEMLSNVNVSYLTLPGEAAISSRGLSYYVLNKRCTGEILHRFLSSSSDEFDRGEKFLNKNEISFINIYNDKNNNYRVYNNETLGGIHIPKKQKT